MFEIRAWRWSSFTAPLLLALLTVGCAGDDSDKKSSEGSRSEDGGADNTDDDSDSTDDSDSADDTPAEDDTTPSSPAPDDDDSSEPEPEPESSSSGDRRRLPQSLREACMDMCDAQFATDCVNPGTSIEICDLQCVATVSNQREFCVEEYTARTECLAEGGFECVNGYVAARSTCASETVAYSECARDLPCKLYCAQMMDAGCSDDEAACRQECFEQTTNSDLSCASRQSIYVNCVGLQGLTCEDGVVRPTQACVSAMFEATNCRNENDLCATWCEGATTLGCGTDDCVSSCEERLGDTTCGSDYQRVLDCGIRYGYVECSDEGLQASHDILCDSEVERYEQCTNPPSEPAP